MQPKNWVGRAWEQDYAETALALYLALTYPVHHLQQERMMTSWELEQCSLVPRPHFSPPILPGYKAKSNATMHVLLLFILLACTVSDSMHVCPSCLLAPLPGDHCTGPAVLPQLSAAECQCASFHQWWTRPNWRMFPSQDSVHTFLKQILHFHYYIWQKYKAE